MPKDRSAIEGILALPEEHPHISELIGGVSGGLGLNYLLRKSLQKAAVRGSKAAVKGSLNIAGGGKGAVMAPSTRLFKGGLRREFGGDLTLFGKPLAVRDSTLGLLAEGVGDTAGVAAAYALQPEGQRPENLGFTNRDFSNPLLGLGVAGGMAALGTGYRTLRGTRGVPEVYHDTGRGWPVPATKHGVQPDRPIPGGTLVNPEYISPVGSELALQRHVDIAMASADDFAEEYGKGSWDLMDADAYDIFSKDLLAAHPGVSPIALSILPVLRPLTKTAKGVGKIHRRVAKILGNDFPSKGDISWLGKQIKKAERKRTENGFFYAFEMAPTSLMAMSMSIARFGFGGKGSLDQLYHNRAMIFNRMVMHEALNGVVTQGRYMAGDTNVAMQIHDYFWGKPKLTHPRAVFDGADANLFDDIEDLGHLRDRLVARAGSRYRAIFAPEALPGADAPTVNLGAMQSLVRPLMQRAKDLTGYTSHPAVFGEKGAQALKTIEGGGMAREAIEAGNRAEEMIHASMMGKEGAELLAKNGKLTAAGRIEANRRLGLTSEQLDDVLTGDFEAIIPAETLWDFITQLRKTARGMEPGAQKHGLNEVIKQFDDTLVRGLDEYADALEATGQHSGFLRQYKELNKAYKGLTNELSGVFGVKFMQTMASDTLTRDGGNLTALIMQGIYEPGALPGGVTGFEQFAMALLPDKQWVDAGILDAAEYKALMERGVTLMSRLQDDIVGYVFSQSVTTGSKNELIRMLQAGDFDTPVTIEFDMAKVSSMLGPGDNNAGKRFWDNVLMKRPQDLNETLSNKLREGGYLTDARIFRPGQRDDLEMMTRLFNTKMPSDLPFRLAIQFLAAHEAAKLVGLPVAAVRGLAGAATGTAGAGAGVGLGMGGLAMGLGPVTAGLAGAAFGILGASFAIGELFKHPKVLDKLLQGAIEQRVVKMTPHLTRSWLARTERTEQIAAGVLSDSMAPVLEGAGADATFSTEGVTAATEETARILEEWEMANTATPETTETPATPVAPLDESPEGPGELGNRALGLF